MSIVSFFADNERILSSFTLFPWLHASTQLVQIPPSTHFFPSLPLISSPNQEVKTTNKIAEWLSNDLKSVLPEKVQPDLEKVAVSGHSKGGNTAFALALDSSTPLKFSALLGIDPVAGTSTSCLRPPYVLRYIPRILNQSIPVAVTWRRLVKSINMLFVPVSCAKCC